MIEKSENPATHAIDRRRGTADKPPHVEKFDDFMGTLALGEPAEKADFLEFRPDATFSFGITGSSGRYFVSVTFDKKSPLVRPIVWHDRPFTSQSFVFSIEDDGSLVRLVDLFVRNGDTRERVACLETNLGPEAGVEFTKYLLGEPWGDKPGIVAFCKGDEELDRKIDGIHDEIEQAMIEEAAKEAARRKNQLKPSTSQAATRAT